jgi:hypothetical protein
MKQNIWTRAAINVFVLIVLAVFIVHSHQAQATFTATGTSLTGDSNSTIDVTGTLGIGNTNTTSITIGQVGQSVTFPGNLIISNGSTPGLTIGTPGSSTGQIALAGATSGTTTIQPASAASGVLILPAATGYIPYYTGSPTSGDCISWGNSGQLTDLGSACGPTQWTTTSTGIFYNGGNVTVGTTKLAADGTYSQVSPDTYIAQNLYEYSNTYYHGFGQVFYRAGGTSASPTYPPNSAYFMAQRFWGYNGTDPWTEAAALVFQTSEQWSSTNQGTGFFMEVTPQGTTGTHRYIVVASTQSGGISIGQPTDTAQARDINVANIHGNLCLGASAFCFSNQAPTNGLLLQGPLRLGASVAVGSLPACAAGTLGQRQLVNNANSATPGTVATGSGTYTIAVECIYNSSGSSYYWIID